MTIFKQHWKILISPDSLVARVLKAKYYPDSDFLGATARSGSSYIWKSLLWGREVIIAGLRWRIGNGSSVKIYSDPWIPHNYHFRPFSRLVLGIDLVQDLIGIGGLWNLDLINQVFLPIDAKKILSISLGDQSRADQLIWHFSSNETYSVRSGYQFLKSLNAACLGPSVQANYLW